MHFKWLGFLKVWWKNYSIWLKTERETIISNYSDFTKIAPTVSLCSGGFPVMRRIRKISDHQPSKEIQTTRNGHKTQSYQSIQLSEVKRNSYVSTSNQEKNAQNKIIKIPTKLVTNRNKQTQNHISQRVLMRYLIYVYFISGSVNSSSATLGSDKVHSVFD